MSIWGDLVKRSQPLISVAYAATNTFDPARFEAKDQAYLLLATF